jgi:hypothetical protein
VAAIGIMLALLAGQIDQPQHGATSGTDDGDIVVLAHALRKVRWAYEAKSGTLSKCEIKRSSGSIPLDSLVCPASAQCAAEHPDLSDIALVPCIRDRVRRLYMER